MRSERRPLSAWLEAGALVQIDGVSVIIGFPPEQAFQKDLIEDGKHIDFLAKAASSILGRHVKIVLKVSEGIVAAPITQPPPEAKLDPMEEFKRDPLIRKALEIFRAEVQPA